MIPAALLCVFSTGCADQQTTAPKLASSGPMKPRVGQAQNVPFNKFFVAWSENYASSPIQQQLFTLDPRQDRQFADYADDRVKNFARTYPGRLYINGDEPDQYCVAPMDYAIWYHDFVQGVLSADATARFSPSGFAEPNYKCCPLPDDVPAPCWYYKHSIEYAQAFYDAYKQRYGVPPRVDEWRFHDFGLRFQPGDVTGWWGRVNQLAQWSADHGAPMVLASWGFMGWRISPGEYQEVMKWSMNRLMNDPRIIGAVYWSYQQWLGNPHYLVEGEHSLTSVGQVYTNPLTDVPTGVTMPAPSNGQAMLQWTNTTGAWGTEVEFWVQAAGAGDFAYRSTEIVPSSGATQSSLKAFNPGESIKARVRYYSAHGTANWSPFSNVVAIQPPTVDASKRATTRKGAIICFVSKRLGGQACT